MWTKEDMKKWETDHIKEWLQELDDTYFELTSRGKKDADDMFQWGLDILDFRIWKGLTEKD